MKTNSRFARSLTAVHVAAVLALAAPPVFGQAAARNKDAEQPAKEKQKFETSAVAPSLFEIEITDGEFIRKGRKQEATLENVVDLLRERHDGANIVLSPGLPRIRIANLKLRATSLEQELEALRVASGNRFTWGSGNYPGSIDPTTGLPVGPVPGMGAPPPSAVDPRTGLPVARNEDRAPLYILNEVPGSMTGAGRRVEVFNLTDYFNSLASADEDNPQKSVAENLERIKAIVTDTLQVIDENHSSSLGFQFHSGANLLVVVGTPDALEVARKVISALNPQPQPVNTVGFPGGIGGGGGLVNPFGATIPGNAVSAASFKARRAIVNKLESIRLDSVMYNGLPLSEVVRNLITEAKKHDPQNVGINFLVNPNPPPVGPVVSTAGGTMAIDPATGLPIANSPPAEAIDINSITIKINPALINVRLLDVLDAIVKVADHPIRYTITDYAVVFSLRGPESSMSETPLPGAAPGAAPALP